METLFKIAAGALVAVALAVLIIVMSVWNGWAVWTVWNWWAPVIGTWFPLITFKGAVGMTCIVGTFTWTLSQRFGSKPGVEETDKENVMKLITILSAPLIIVAGNWLVLTVLV